MSNNIKVDIYHISNREKAALFVVFCLIFSVFLFTMPRQITLEDDGLFLMSSYFAGISQPPGYPLFSLIGNLVASLPFGTVPVRIHAMSAFFGAATCITMALFIRTLIPSLAVILISVLVYAVSKLYWSQSIIAEVYTLNSFLLFTLFFLISVLIKTVHEKSEENINYPQVKRILTGIAFFYGLSLTVHLPVMVLSAIPFLILLWPVRKLVFNKIWYYGLAFLIGLTPYIWFIWRSQTGVIINFYGPIQSFYDFLFIILRQGFVDVDVSNAAGLEDKIAYIKYFFYETGNQYFWLSYAFIFIGFIAQWYKWPKRVCVSLLVFYFINSFLFLLVLYFDYDLLSRSVFSVYPMLSYAVMAIWLGLGVCQAAIVLKEYIIKTVSLEFLTLTIGLILIIGTFHQNIKINDRSSYRWADDYAVQLLKHLPKSAVLFVSGDIPTFTVGYKHHVEGVREDIEIYEATGLLFSNRLFDRRKTSDSEALHILEQFVNKSERNICTTNAIVSSRHQVDSWLFSCFSDDENKLYSIQLSQGLLNLYEEILEQKNHTDVWTIHHRQKLIKRMGVLLGKLSVQKEKDNTGLLTKYLELTLNEFHGALGYLEGKMSYTLEVQDINQMITIIHNIKHVPYLGKKRDKASFYHIRGYISVLAGNNENAAIEYKKSLGFWPEKNNPAFNRLLQLYKNQKNDMAYQALQQEFY